MSENRIPKVLMTALRPRRRYWIILFVLGVAPMLASFCFDPAMSSKTPDLLMAFGGWLLTLSGILLAGNQASRIALTEAFSKLYDQESSTEQYHNKQKIFSFAKSIAESDNRYRAAREKLAAMTEDEQKELHEARRHLKHFWVPAEAYYESGLMTPSEIFSVAGPPEILLALEPLEVLAAESIVSPMKNGAWPSLWLLKEWYKIKDERPKAQRVSIFIPMDEGLYIKSLT